MYNASYGLLMGLILFLTVLVFITTFYIHHIQRRLRSSDVFFVCLANTSVIAVLLFTIWDQDTYSKMCWGLLCLILFAFVLRIFFGRHKIKKKEKLSIYFLFSFTLLGLLFYLWFMVF